MEKRTPQISEATKKEMAEFFMKTSIPRLLKKEVNHESSSGRTHVENRVSAS